MAFSFAIKALTWPLKFIHINILFNVSTLVMLNANLLSNKHFSLVNYLLAEFPLMLPRPPSLDMYNVLRELNGEQEIVEMCPQRDFFFQ